MIKRINPDRINFDPNYRESVYHHLTFADISRALDVQGLYSDGYRFVSIYRNPFDRLVSMYEYGIQTGGRMLTKGKTFKEWFFDRPVSPQTHGFLRDEESALVSRIKIIDFSSFEPNVKDFLVSCGINPESLPWEKKSSRSDWRSYYDDRMIEILSAECSEDILLASSLDIKINY